MGIFSSREDDQSEEICVSRHILNQHEAYSVVLSEFFLFAAKTTPHVCYKQCRQLNE